MPTYTVKPFKTILNKMKIIDQWFWCKYTTNPYNGCQFGCVYCDSRSVKYHLPDDFDKTIIIKENPAEMLDKRISRARTLLPDVVGMGGTTDSYQPAESVYKNTQNMLKVLLKHHYPVMIITKSRLIMRDIELIREIAQDSWATIAFTITSPDKKTSRFLERRVPTPQERFKMISKIKHNAPEIQVGITYMPIVPGLCDDEASIEEMVKCAKESGAEFIMPAGMTLRDEQANHFLSNIAELYPEIIPQYEKIYGFKYVPRFYFGRYGPASDYYKKLIHLFLEKAEKYNINTRMKRFIPSDFRRENYMIAERLLNRSLKLQWLGRYWKKDFWAGQDIQNLDQPIREIYEAGKLETMRNMKGKILDFVIQWLNENHSKI